MDQVCFRFLLKYAQRKEEESQPRKWILYFQMCEAVLLPPGQKATYLYTLMFYNVMSYCANYLREVYSRKNWSPYVTITETSQVRHLAMSATKITLEWTKFLLFLMTALFVVLTIALGQELTHVHPSATYIIMTSLHYLTTEPLVVQEAANFPLFHTVNRFDSQEVLWSRLLLKLTAVILSSILGILTLLKGRTRIFLPAFYVNIYLKCRDALSNEIAQLLSEDARMRRFRWADPSEIREFSDVCAICLGEMKRAKQTKCRHLFHTHCLNLALQNSDLCPTCKSEIWAPVL